MITLFIWLLTALLVIASLFLILLVLIQLPKKEAGAGLAFGAGTADALLGAGSGNALTKVTKYTVIAFFVLSIVLSVTYNHANRARLSGIKNEISKNPVAGVQPAPAPVANPAVQPPSTNLLTPLTTIQTNKPAGTNSSR
jgi:preprotein translocase subunit SecG